MQPDQIPHRPPIEIDWPPKPAEAPRRRRLDWRTLVGGLGRVFIATGLLLFGFVAYQLWGTGIQQARSQDRLQDRFAQLVGATTTAPDGAPPPTTDAGSGPPSPEPTGPATTAAGPTLTAVTAGTPVPGTAATGAGADPSATAAAATAATTPPRAGEPVARLVIARIGVDQVVVAGVSVEDLKKGPGHYPDTPLPGQIGNAAIAGHRSTFGAPFARVDELARGDEIDVTTAAGRFVYRVVDTRIVEPTEIGVIANTVDPELTLTSCWPKYSAAKRIVVRAALDVSAGAAAVPVPGPATTVAPGVTTTSATAATVTTEAGADPSTVTSAVTSAATSTVASAGPARTVAPDAAGAARTSDAFRQGWWSDDAAWGDVISWGCGLIGVALAAWVVSRRARRNWVGAVVGVGPFLVLLYFFYENAARLLPPNI